MESSTTQQAVDQHSTDIASFWRKLTNISYSATTDIVLPQYIVPTQWLPTSEEISQSSYQAFELDLFGTEYSMKPKQETYKILISWGGNPEFRALCTVDGTSPEDAAKKRVAMLAYPTDYDSVLVVHCKYNEAVVFPVSQFLETPKPSSSLVPSPRYGWRG